MVKSPEKVSPHPVLNEYYDSAESRRSEVDQMFDSSAEHYDWITNVMSFGSGAWYRRDALRRVGVGEGAYVLDTGAGTGVVSLLSKELVGKTGKVVSLDPSPGMLGVAVQNGINLPVLGLGEKLPFPDNTFDFVTMGYALRHVEDLNLLFEEYLRVLKPGGRVLLLEITRPDSKLGTVFLKAYLNGVVPLITRIFRRSANAQRLMEYYWDTIDQCVRPEVILKALEEQGFSQTKRHAVMGIFSEYTGSKKETEN